jgi:8-oxo-dGTP pyrophosphatase MutT (NUDIX family)
METSDLNFAHSYLGSLRALVGNRPLLSVGVRVLIEDQGKFLIIRRSDSGNWGLPGGSMELGESLMDAIHREAFEEANVTLRSVKAFGLSSDPIVERHTYPNGDIVQNVSLLAHAFVEHGEIASNDGEAFDFRFCPEEDINEASFVRTEFPTFGHWRKFRETSEFQFV